MAAWDPSKPKLEKGSPDPRIWVHLPAPEDAGGSGEGSADDQAAEELGSKAKKKKKYHRHPKPPYTYLAMIALVIRAAPDRKLKLSQIIKEISTVFPFFKETYQGWKDSIRHNLSANDCFHKVLKDPSKPKAKGNFWTVDVDLIPPEALKLQNTAIARQEERAFAVDLAPFVYHGWAFSSPQAPLHVGPSEGSGFPTSEGARQSSPFSIDSLLHDFQDVGLSGKAKARADAGPLPSPAAALGGGGTVPIFRVSPGAPVLPWRPPRPLPLLCSLPSFSPKGREAGRQKPTADVGSSALAKRPWTACPPAESSSSDSEEDGFPPQPPSCWEQLPTSYTSCVAPNVVVVPPSNALPFSAFPPSQGLSPCSPMPFAPPAYWELMRQSSLRSPVPSSRVCLDLDEAMPPNKTVFDVWMSHPMETVLPAASPWIGSSPGAQC